MNTTETSSKLENLSNILILSKYPNISDAGKFLESFNRTEHGNQRQRKYTREGGRRETF